MLLPPVETEATYEELLAAIQLFRKAHSMDVPKDAAVPNEGKD